MEILQNKIKLRDKRTCQPIGYKNKSGEVIVLVFGESVTINGKILNFTKPNIVSLFLNKGLKEYTQSKNLKRNIEKIPIGQSQENTSLFFDYFECTMSGIINMYCAAETFANQCIPNDFLYRRKNGKGIIEELSKSEVERWCSLDEKLNVIIPKIYNIQAPNQMSFWNQFRILEIFRNDIIHPKTYRKEIRINVGDPIVKVEDKFLKMLCEDDLDEIINSSIALIKYIVNSTPPNSDYPILGSRLEVVIKDVEDFGDELFLTS